MSTTKYAEVRAQRKRSEGGPGGKGRDCAVIAIALACDVTYDKAHEALAAAGRRDGRPTYDWTMVQALKILGWKAEVANWKGKTAATLKLPYGRHLVFVRGHVFCNKAGQSHDWTNGRRHRICKVWKLSRI